MKIRPGQAFDHDTGEAFVHLLEQRRQARQVEAAASGVYAKVMAEDLAANGGALKLGNGRRARGLSASPGRSPSGA
jgi:hypothetical protein